MYLAKVTLRYDSEESDLAYDRLRANLLRVYHQGFCLEPVCSTFLQEDSVYSHVILPERSTIHRIMASEILQKFMASEILPESECNTLPVKFELLEHAVGMPELCDCTVVKLFILDSSDPIPLSCGSCGGAIPLYRIPPTYVEDPSFYDLDCWRKESDLWADLEFYSFAFSSLAQKELVDLDSKLNRKGRRIAKRVEDVTEFPCYYFLRDLRDVDELKREPSGACPGCGRDWLLDVPFLEYYDYRCDQCRLLGRLPADLRRRDRT